MHGDDRILTVSGVSKNYRGLRPLRVKQLEVHSGEAIGLVGFDQVTAEVLVDLITGATVPEAGEIVAFGRATTAIRDGDEWLHTLDAFGLLSERAVLVEQFSAEQNLTLPLSLELDAVEAPLRRRVRALGEEVGLEAGELDLPVSQLSALGKLRVRLGRALALDPRLLLAEHPNATLSADETTAFAAGLSRILAWRRLAALVMTADRRFASAVAERVLTLQPGTGDLAVSSVWRRWFS